MIAFLLAAAKSSGVLTLILYGAIFGAMYFLLIRPQQRRKKEAMELHSSLAIGDEVELTSGILGFISDIEDGILWIDIADGHGSERIEVRVTRRAIARKVDQAVSAPDSK